MKDSIHRLMIAGLVLLLALTVAPNQCVQNDAVAQTPQADEGIIEVDINPNGTYLHAVNWYPQFGPGPADLTPTIVDLQAVGLNPGDQVMLSIAGRWSTQAAWGTPETDTWVEAEKVHLLGVFSTTSTLEPLKDRYRVPGAIDYGQDYVTPATWWSETLEEANANEEYDPPLKGGNAPTDIPEDFQITPYSGMFIEIPRNSKFLMFAFAERYPPDNAGNIKVTLEKDTDGDGLPDSWELNGMDLDKDGEVDLDLPMLEADWQRKDIFVEADYMSGRAPIGDAMSDVENAFAANGINLHVIVGESIPFATVLNSWAEYDALKASYFGTADERSNPNAMEAKKLVFRYCLFVHQIWFDPPDYDVPGVAETLGNDFIVAAGAFPNAGTRQYQAAVFMHELGHTLGLQHGGMDNENYKPNYFSVMNYAFEFPVWMPNRPLDYSHGLFIELDEASLNENEGIGLSEVTVWRAPDGLMHRSDGDLAIDWNCDNVTEAGVQVNLNDNPREPSPAGQKLKDYNDWANLVYRFRDTPNWAASATLDEHHAELTGRQIQEMEEEAKDMPALPSSGSGGLTAVIYAVIGAAAVGAAVTAVLLYRRRRGQPTGK